MVIDITRIYLTHDEVDAIKLLRSYNIRLTAKDINFIYKCKQLAHGRFESVDIRDGSPNKWERVLEKGIA